MPHWASNKHPVWWLLLVDAEATILSIFLGDKGTSHYERISNIPEKALKKWCYKTQRLLLLNFSECTWWLNQPIWNMCSSNWIISPSSGCKLKHCLKKNTYESCVRNSVFLVGFLGFPRNQPRIFNDPGPGPIPHRIHFHQYIYLIDLP